MFSRRLFVSLAFAALAFPTAALAQSSAEKSPDFKVEDVPAVFKSIFDAKTPRPKDQFETDEEYRRRSQSTVDLYKTYYVKVERKNVIGMMMPETYSYKIDSGDLVIYAGDYITEKMEKSATFKTVPFCIQTDDRSGGDYEGTNGFGAKVNVKKSYIDNYVLNITNCKEFDSKFADFRKHQLGVGVQILDRDEAKRLSREDGEIVIAFRIANIPDSKTWNDYEEPTFRDPNEVYTTRYSVVASLEEIILLDRKTHTIVAKVGRKSK